MVSILKSDANDNSEITIDFKKRSILDFKQITNYEENLKKVEKKLKRIDKKPSRFNEAIFEFTLSQIVGGIVCEEVNATSLKDNPFYNNSKKEFLIPCFFNMYLRWKLEGDMKKQLTSIKVRSKKTQLTSEGYLRVIFLKLIAKIRKVNYKEIITEKNRPYWYVVFQFERTPRNGSMILEYI